MKKILRSIVFVLLCLFVSDESYCQHKQATPTIAILDVTVIDATGRSAQPGMTVLITDSIITGVRHDKKLKLNTATKVIDGKGKYLIPGLWDMHVHLRDDNMFLPLMLANGVTSTRDMFANRKDFLDLHKLRKQIREGKAIGPNLYIPLAVLGPDQKWYGAIEVTNEQEAVETVHEIKKMGADFIKVFDLYDPKVFLALLNEAKKCRIPVAGHCPICLNATVATEAGQTSFEHLLGIILSSSSNEDEIRNSIIAKAGQVHESLSDLTHVIYFIQSNDLVESYDKEKAEHLFSVLKESGSYQCPTLAFWDGMLQIIDADTIKDDRYKYVPYKYQKTWTDLKYNRYTTRITHDEYNQVKQLVLKRFEIVNDLNKNGVLFIAGTDASWNNARIIPGFGLHDELSLLVKAGLTPIQAIQAASRNAAASLGVSYKTGTIEKGKSADLVLLDANPLEDINNTRKINAVIKTGVYLSRERLDSILKSVEVLAMGNR